MGVVPAERGLGPIQKKNVWVASDFQLKGHSAFLRMWVSSGDVHRLMFQVGPPPSKKGHKT